MDYSLPGSSVHGIFQTRVLEWIAISFSLDCHFLLQRIFPTQRSNPSFPHCRQRLYHLSHQGSIYISAQFSSVAQSSPTLCNPMDCSTSGLPVQASLSIINSWSLLKLMFIELVMPSNHFTLCRPLLLLPSIFPSIRVFSSGHVWM